MDLTLLFKNRQIFLITSAFFFLFLGFDGAQQYVVPLLEEEGRGRIALASLVLIYLTFFITSFTAEKFIRLISPKWSMVLGMIPYPLFCFAASTSCDYVLILISLFLGAGAALIWNASGQLIAASIDKDQMGKAVGLNYTAVFVGGFVGAAVGGLLIPVVSASLLFMGFGIFALVGLFCGILVHNRTIPDETPAEEVTSGRSLGIITIPVISGYFLMMFSFSGLKILILEREGLGLVGSVGTMLKLGATIGTMFLGSYLSFCQLRWIACFGFVGCCAIGCGLLMPGHGALYCIIGSLMASLYFGSIYPLCQAYIRTNFPLHSYASINASFTKIKTFGMLTGIAISLLVPPSYGFAVGLFGIFLGVIILVRQEKSVCADHC